MRNEFGRLIGKKVAELIGKPVDFLRPEIVVLVNPYADIVNLQSIHCLLLEDTRSWSGAYRSQSGSVPIAAEEAVRNVTGLEKCIQNQWRKSSQSPS
jgi:tRNA U54 and U55 pseudouridine synthase Pus10